MSFNVICGNLLPMTFRSLDQQPPLPGAEAVAVAAAVAAGLSELHEAGLVHGALGPDHVLVDEAGGVTLVPARDPVEADVQPSADIASLGHLLTRLAERAPDRPVRPSAGLLRVPHPAQLLDELARRCLVATAADRPSARLVADTLHRRLPHARLPLSSSAEQPARRRKHTVDRQVVLGSVIVVALVAAVVAPARCAASSAAAPKPPMPARHWDDGVLTVGSRRYAVGEPGDEVLVDEWACSPASVALLRRATGDVVAFDRFPKHGQPAIGRVLVRIPDALRLVRRRAADTCADLAVATADGRTIPVEWRQAS